MVMMVIFTIDALKNAKKLYKSTKEKLHAGMTELAL
jgi:hypothetical protein